MFGGLSLLSLVIVIICCRGIEVSISGCGCCLVSLGLVVWIVCGLSRHDGLSCSLANWGCLCIRSHEVILFFCLVSFSIPDRIFGRLSS